MKTLPNALGLLSHGEEATPSALACTDAKAAGAAGAAAGQPGAAASMDGGLACLLYIHVCLLMERMVVVVVQQQDGTQLQHLLRVGGQCVSVFLFFRHVPIDGKAVVTGAEGSTWRVRVYICVCLGAGVASSRVTLFKNMLVCVCSSGELEFFLCLVCSIKDAACACVLCACASPMLNKSFCGMHTCAASRQLPMAVVVDDRTVVWERPSQPHILKVSVIITFFTNWAKAALHF